MFDMQNLSRRSFFKLGAGMLAGAALFDFTNLNHKAFAKGVTSQNFSITPVSIKNLPQATKAIEQSAIVKNAYNYILSSVEKINNLTLRKQTLDLIQNTRPTFMQLYTSSTSITGVYNELANKGLVDTSNISPEKLFPALKNNANPQEFISAPGSGYASHHAYPGGLPTHVAANLSITEGIINTYKLIFGYTLDTDIVYSAQALHDLAKPWVFQWNDDGTCFTEYTIAGTGAHHILSLTEAIYRHLPAEEIVAQACAHNHSGSDKDERDVVNWLKAASVIAQINPVQYGLLDKSGEKIPIPQHQEGYVVHLGDHDWVLSGAAAKNTVLYLQEIAKEDYNFSDKDLHGALFNHFRNYIGAQVSFMFLHNLMAQNGLEDVRNLVHQIIIK